MQPNFDKNGVFRQTAVTGKAGKPETTKNR